jgi:hypothetical protein
MTPLNGAALRRASATIYAEHASSHVALPDADANAWRVSTGPTTRSGRASGSQQAVRSTAPCRVDQDVEGWHAFEACLGRGTAHAARALELPDPGAQTLATA